MMDQGDGGWMKADFDILRSKKEIIYNIIRFFFPDSSSKKAL